MDDAVVDVKTSVREQRRAFARSQEGHFARTMREAMDEYREMRGQGVSREDGCKGLAEVLRGLLKTTKFARDCDGCDDTGWTERRCTHEMRCARRWCREAHPAHEHVYVEPCSCARGLAHQKRVVQVEDEIAAAGRTAKKKAKGNWSRL